MTQESHDHNFKNLLADFPKEALDRILPEATEKFGKILKIEFVRQEPKKRRLSDAHLALDMPILFSFEKGRILLWLLEFQEDKNRFSIHRLLKYTADETEAYPEATVIPTVLFTDRKKWNKKKDVTRNLNIEFGGRTFLHFEYVFIKLFDLNARDYYHYDNPLIKILLPKMNYDPEERAEVIRQALLGLYRLVTPMLFDKYADFIDVYAGIREEERESICQEINDKKEETAMLVQYFRDKFSQEGRQEGLSESLRVFLEEKFGTNALKLLENRIKDITDTEKLRTLTKAVARAASPQDVLNFIEAEKLV